MQNQVPDAPLRLRALREVAPHEAKDTHPMRRYKWRCACECGSREAHLYLMIEGLCKAKRRPPFLSLRGKRR